MLRRIFKFLRWSITILLLIVIIAGASGYLYSRSSLPQVDGSVQVPGLSATVEIIRDQANVPHIYAQTRNDAWFGLGYVHAQDRLWQLEFQRRIAQGRIAEAMGASALETDRFLRTVGFYRSAQATWTTLPKETRAAIEAYAAGINAFLDGHRQSSLPPEFLLFGTPQPWTGPDVVVWAKIMAWDLAGDIHQSELFRSQLIRAVGVERTNQLLPDEPPDSLRIIQSPAAAQTAQPAASAQTAARLAISGVVYEQLAARNDQLRKTLSIVGYGGQSLGSNNWVVSGAKSTSGKPILANDPHLGTRIPSTWYLAHISAGDLDVIGATIPGLPSVVIGRNQSIAWGITNLRPDVQDLYRERLDASGTQAEFQGKLEPIQTITETIAVRLQAPVAQVVRTTRHGPLISDVLDLKSELGAQEAIALRWTALDTHDGTITTFLGINQARNWDEFRQAFRSYVAPAQNFVYADVDGNIGYLAPGRIPIRSSGDGTLPAEGWSGANEWTGWVPFEEIPQTYNPPEQMIVTANNRPTGDDYPYFLGRDWNYPFRAGRIRELLQQKAQLSPDDFAAIQGDTVSSLARKLIPQLLPLITPQTDAERRAVELLRSWDYDMRSDSQAAAIYAAWLRQLPRALVGDELGRDLAGRYQWSIETDTGAFLTNTLQDRDNPWCDMVDTQPRETCTEVAHQTFATAIRDLQGLMGDDLQAWRWDRIHAVMFQHQPFGQIPVLSSLYNRSIPTAGDWTSVNYGPFSIEGDFMQYSAPGYRQIIDLADSEGGRFIQAVGQSTHILSPYYDNYLADWQSVRYYPMHLSRAAVDQSKAHMLRLEPHAGE